MSVQSASLNDADYLFQRWCEFYPACPIALQGASDNLAEFGRFWGWPQLRLFGFRFLTPETRFQMLSEVVVNGPESGDSLIAVGFDDVYNNYMCVDRHSSCVWVYAAGYSKTLVFLNTNINSFAKCTVIYHIYRTDPRNLTQSGSSRFVNRLRKALASIDADAVKQGTWWDGILWDVEVGLL